MKQPPEKYINPFTDFGFKRIFGTEFNKVLLIDFVNQVLGEREKVKNLTYLNNEALGKTYRDRKAIFDLYCENERGERFIVELQNVKQEYFIDRSIFYSTFPIQSQAPKGKEWDYHLKAVFTICLLNFSLPNKDDQGRYMREVMLMDKLTHAIFYEKLTFIYLEIPKFTKSEEELETHFDKWLYVLKHLPKFQDRPKRLQEKIFERLFEEAEIAKLKPEDMRKYDESLKIYRDNRNTMEYAKKEAMREGRQKGWEEGKKEGKKEGKREGKREGLKEGLKEGVQQGIQQGRAEGMREKQVEIAKMLKKNGVSNEVIIESTGLTKEQIEKLDLGFPSR